MTQANEERTQAAEMIPGSVIAILLEQHASIRDLFSLVKKAEGARQQQLFDELRRLLAVHETGEELVLRPVTRGTAGADVAEAREQEEQAAARAIAGLEQTRVGTPEFMAAFAEFEQAVSDHAEREEQLEFPRLLADRSPEMLVEMGRMLLTGQSSAAARQRAMSDSAASGHGAAATFEEMLAQARAAFAG